MATKYYTDAQIAALTEQAKKMGVAPPDFNKPPSSAAYDKLSATNKVSTIKTSSSSNVLSSLAKPISTTSVISAPSTIDKTKINVASIPIDGVSKAKEKLATAEEKLKKLNKDDLENRVRQFDNEQDKKATEALINLQFGGTSLDKEARYFKPVAFIDYYTPYVKVKIFAPQKSKPGQESEPTANIGLLDTEFPSENSSDILIQNNYVESLSLSAEGGPLKFTLKLIDTSLNFSDTLLMRFAKQFSAGIYLEISYGWSNKKDYENIKRTVDGIEEIKPIHYINNFVGLLQDVEVDETDTKRTLTITGMQFDTLPGELMYLTPYNELGPYPMMTYQFLNFLSLNEKQMNDILITASHFNAAAPEDIKGNDTKTERNIKKKTKAGFVSVLGGTGETAKYKKAISEYQSYKSKLSKDDTRYELLQNIENANASTTNTLSPEQIFKFYTHKNFLSIVQAEDNLGIATRTLMELFTTILRDIRIHPWVAFQYISKVMHSKMTIGTSNKKNPILVNDFVGVLQSVSANLDLTPNIEKIAGWDNWDKKSLDQIYRDNESLKIIGVLPTDIAVNKETSWGGLLEMIASKCYVFVEKEKDYDIDSSGEIKTKLAEVGGKIVRVPVQKKPEDVQKAAQEKDSKSAMRVDFNDAAGGITDGKKEKKGKKSAAKIIQNYRSMEPLKVQCFCTTKRTAVNILEGEKLLNEAKLKMSVRSSSAFDKMQFNNPSYNKTLAQKANERINATLKNVTETDANAFFFCVNIYNNKQAEMFDSNFGGQQIHQAYSFRFKTQNNYAVNFNPGLPNIKMIDFPDVISFKPDMKGVFAKMQNVISASKFLKIDIPDGSGSKARLISGDTLNARKEIADLKDSKIQLDTEENQQETTKERKEEISKQKREINQRIDELTKLGANITENPNAMAIYNNPIYLDMSTSMTALNGNGLNNNSVGILKNNIVNFRKRFMMDAQSINATLEIMGDASFKDTTNFMSDLIFIRVLNPDGSDSMHTGIYRVTGYRHELTSGAFKTTLPLVKDSTVNNPKLISQLNDVIYTDVLTKQEAWDAILNDKNFRNNLQKGQDAAGVKQALRTKFPGKSEQELDKMTADELNKATNSKRLFENTEANVNENTKYKEQEDAVLSKKRYELEQIALKKYEKEAAAKPKAKMASKKTAVSKLKK